MKRILLLLAIFSFCYINLSAQTVQPRRSFANRGIVYNKELAFDFRVNTFRGFSFAVNVGKIISYDKTRYYHFEFGNLRHPKEFKQNDQFSRRFGGRRSFFYGKQNSMFVLRGGWGTKKYLSQKASTRGVAIGINYEIGPSLGILKPYYLEVSNPDAPIREIKYSPEEEDLFLDFTKIQGAAPFSRGITELSFLPGAQFKASFHFDWGAFDEYVKAMDVGIMGDFYLSKAEILVDSFDGSGLEGVQNRQFFINLFVSLQLGKRN